MRYALVFLAACSFHEGSLALSQDPSGQDGGPGDPTVDAAIDAPGQATPDAPPDGPAAFDPAMCPASYTDTIGSSPKSRYRVITAQDVFAVQNADCNDDHPGWTHLVVLESDTEAQDIRDHLTSNTFYVGAVQARDQGSTNGGWYLFTGAAVPDATWQSGQPNDNEGFESNDQNLAAADATYSGRLNDVAGTYSYEAVCECDGQAIPSSVQQLITANTP